MPRFRGASPERGEDGMGQEGGGPRFRESSPKSGDASPSLVESSPDSGGASPCCGGAPKNSGEDRLFTSTEVAHFGEIHAHRGIRVKGQVTHSTNFKESKAAHCLPQSPLSIGAARRKRCHIRRISVEGSLPAGLGGGDYVRNFLPEPIP